MADPEYKFIKDKPLENQEALFKNFYHTIIAPALLNILGNADSPHTIGLYGSWGTGKSTIIENIKHDKSLNTEVFVFDAWKYENDALRRTFLIKLYQFLQSKKDLKDKTILRDLYEGVTSTKNKEAEPKTQLTRKQAALRFLTKNILFLIFIVALIVVAITAHIAPHSWLNKVVHDFTQYLSAFAAAAYVLQKIWEKGIDNLIDRLYESVAAENEKYILSISKEPLNSPELFEEKFNLLLKKYGQDLIIVFDNLDRVEGKVALSMLSTIKTFMEPPSAKKVTFIIPCDPKAMDTNIGKYLDSVDVSKNAYGSAEYLRKIFNLILWIPDYVKADMNEFTKHCLGLTGDISSVIKKRDVVFVISSAFSSNPREIIQFVNNFVAYIVTAYQSGVKDIITNEDNVAYAAKVLVLREKFPSTYEKLKEHWHEPENIVDKDDSEELKEFMNVTRRISTGDAEPFLYFKNPEDARGLKNHEELKQALINGDQDKLQEIVKSENNNEAVIEYFLDLIQRYAQQLRIALPIYNTHFASIYPLLNGDVKKSYFDIVPKIIDTSLWKNYTDLNVDSTFELIKNNGMPKEYRDILMARYLSIFTAGVNENPDSQFMLGVFKNLLNTGKTLNSDQRASLLNTIEELDTESAPYVELLANINAPEVVSEKLILDYIKQLDGNNVEHGYKLLKHFSKFITENSLVVNLLTNITDRLQELNAANSIYSPEKAGFARALISFMQEYPKSAKSLTANFDTLAPQLIFTEDNTLDAKDKVPFVKALWYINVLVSDSIRVNIEARATNFISLADHDSIVDFVDFWNEGSAQHLIDKMISSLYPKVLQDSRTATFIYAKAKDTTKDTLLAYIVQNADISTDTDVLFLNSIVTKENKLSLIEAIVSRYKNEGTLEQKHIDFINLHTNRNDDQNVKSAISGLHRDLLSSERPGAIQAGLRLAQGSKTITTSGMRVLAIDLLTTLKQKVLASSEGDDLVMEYISDLFDKLQSSPQQDYVFMIFNLLVETTDPALIDTVLKILNKIKPSYKTYPKDYEDTYTRLQAWNNKSTQHPIIQTLLNVTDPKGSTAEKQYRDKLQGLLNDTEEQT